MNTVFRIYYVHFSGPVKCCKLLFPVRPSRGHLFYSRNHCVRPFYTDGFGRRRLGSKMAEDLTIEEQETVKNFMEEIHRLQIEIDQNNTPVQWNTAVKFLMARKFDTRRALELFRSHETMRHKEGITSFDPRDDGVRRELCSEKLTVLPGRDLNGAAIALFTARLHHPTQTTHQAVLKALIFQLDVAMESIDTQRNGLIFIYDMTSSKYINFDYELSIKILSMLKGSYPARLKKVLVVTAPMWFRAPFKILRLFVKEKLRDRVYTVNITQLSAHVPVSSLPRRLGGLCDVNHCEWVSRCLKSTWHKSSTDDDEIAAYVAQLAARPSPADAAPRPSISSASPSIDGIWDTEALTAALGHDGSNTASLDFEWDSSSFGANSPPSAPSSRKRSVDLTPPSPPTTTAPAPAPLLLLSPPPAKRRLSSNSGELSIHGLDPGGLSIKELVEYCKIKGQRGLIKEYKIIKDEEPQGTFDVSRSKVNMYKNRYTDVLCLDQSRVVLRTVDGDPSSDYINANFVDGYRQKNAYISTQGPLPKTFADFWRMVWEQEVLIVVMTTRTVERGRVKCSQYWPLDEESMEQYGAFVVENTGIDEHEHYSITSLLLQNLETLESRAVTHLQFTGWPDYGVPHCALSFLDFMFLVRERQRQRSADAGFNGNGPPIVIHCSAGIGRTGTFITMDINTRRLADVGRVDVATTVRRVRSQRAFSIQMPDQYVFCHVALVEHAMRDGLLPPVEDGCPGPLDGFEDETSSGSD